MSDQPDVLIACPKCSDEAGYPYYRHRSFFRVGRRNCMVCEIHEELEKAARLKTTGVLWKPSHGPKPLISEEEKFDA